jgi:hypothetical protein
MASCYPRRTAQIDGFGSINTLTDCTQHFTIAAIKIGRFGAARTLNVLGRVTSVAPGLAILE